MTIKIEEVKEQMTKPDIEKWLPVLGYEGLYEVSNKGRVKSFYRKKIKRKNPKILKSTVGKQYGYEVICLSKNGIKKQKRINILVLEAFTGHRPSGYEAAHNDGVRTNNNLSNLSWKTRAENEMDKIKHGTVINGIKNHNAKLTDNDIRKIRRLYKPRIFSQRKLAEMFNIAESAIWNILHGRRWQHVK